MCGGGYFSEPVPCEQVSAGLLTGAGTTAQSVSRTSGQGVMDQWPLCPALLPLRELGPFPSLGRGKKSLFPARSTMWGAPLCWKQRKGGYCCSLGLAGDAGPVPCSPPLLCAVPHHVLGSPAYHWGQYVTLVSVMHHAMTSRVQFPTPEPVQLCVVQPTHAVVVHRRVYSTQHKDTSIPP